MRVLGRERGSMVCLHNWVCLPLGMPLCLGRYFCSRTVAFAVFEDSVCVRYREWTGVYVSMSVRFLCYFQWDVLGRVCSILCLCEYMLTFVWGFPGGAVVKSPPCKVGGFSPWVRKIPCSRK